MISFSVYIHFHLLFYFHHSHDKEATSNKGCFCCCCFFFLFVLFLFPNKFLSPSKKEMAYLWETHFSQLFIILRKNCYYCCFSLCVFGWCTYLWCTYICIDHLRSARSTICSFKIKYHQSFQVPKKSKLVIVYVICISMHRHRLVIISWYTVDMVISIEIWKKQCYSMS